MKAAVRGDGTLACPVCGDDLPDTSPRPFISTRQGDFYLCEPCTQIILDEIMSAAAEVEIAEAVV